MKRIPCLILCMTLVLALFGCGGSQENSGNQGCADIAGTFSVGYGRADISPSIRYI